MKLLSRIKLINWHYLINEQTDFKGSTLITGDNGSGKSTILDAIQLVLVADLRHIKFNVSAHDETQRDILGYVRCKTGIDSETGQKYLRTGDISTYVALEFCDTKRKSSFILGVVIDSYSDDVTYKHNYFKIEDQSISDELFLKGNAPRNLKEFRIHMKNYKCQIYPTVEQYKEDLLVKLGSIGERFFSLFIKAISFKAITNIREFVYDYVLGEKSVNIDAMLENFRRYREYLDLVDDIKVRVKKLDDIVKKFGEIKGEEEKALIQDYIIKRAVLHSKEQETQTNACELDLAKNRLNDVEDEIIRINDVLEASEEEYLRLRDVLTQNSTYQILKELDNEIGTLAKRLEELKEKEDVYLATAKAEASNVDDLVTRGRDILDAGQKEFLKGMAVKLEEASHRRMQPSVSDLQHLEETFHATMDAVGEMVYEYRTKVKEFKSQEVELRENIERLKKQERVYDRTVTELRKVISDYIWNEKGVDMTPDVLCELLEVPNEKWQNAVEGFLNTQRFDLIVPPDYFDISLEAYERFKEEMNIYGVGLVNTGKAKEHIDSCLPGSLAAEVVTDNPYARGYVNQIMGTLVKCENEKELKKHRRAITWTCMTYINNTARQIKFSVYRTPYIGSQAIVRQLEQAYAQLKEVLEEKETLTRSLDNAEGILWSASNRDANLYRLSEGISIFEKYDNCLNDFNAKCDEKENLDTSSADQISKQMTVIQTEIRGVKERRDGFNKDKGVLEERIRQLTERGATLDIEVRQAADDLERFVQCNAGISKIAEARYEKEFLDKGPNTTYANFVVARKKFDTIISGKEKELTQLKAEYNSIHHFGGSTNPSSIKEYDDEYRKLVDSALPEYEEKIRTVMHEAEEEFKEHFIYKLRENVEIALTEFQALNEALKGIEFGGDRYRFVATPASEHRKLYDLIMDPFLMNTDSLSADAFQQRHKDAMDELFDELMHQRPEYVDEKIREYTDYRTFLDYDIKITNSDGQTSTFSKICREKSGGETQNPYYVAIVASFMQLYRVKADDNTIRLMMFDEAFNRMDSDRVENTLKFLSRLGLQPIIAAPTDKCEYISPHVDCTLLVLRNNKASLVEQFVRTAV